MLRSDSIKNPQRFPLNPINHSSLTGALHILLSPNQTQSANYDPDN